MSDIEPSRSQEAGAPLRARAPSGEPITAAQVRYIKLGAGNAWEGAIDRGELQFSESPVSRELADAQDFDGMRAHLIGLGYSAGKASALTREIREFFTLGPDCLWITFARGHLWWAFVEPQVHWLGGDGSSHGQRMRKVIGHWSKSDLQGHPLVITTLSTRLTRVRGYRQTICGVSAEGYLLDRINGRENPIVKQGEKARADLLVVAGEAIAHLDWADFETMVDLIFARSGYQRVSTLGGVQADVDLILEHPATAERSFVQVKSSADQSVLDDYLARFEASSLNRMFFVCHSPTGPLRAERRGDVHVWTGVKLAERAVDSGLFGWLMDRMK